MDLDSSCCLFSLLDNFACYWHGDMVSGSSFVLLMIILNETNIEANSKPN